MAGTRIPALQGTLSRADLAAYLNLRSSSSVTPIEQAGANEVLNAALARAFDGRKGSALANVQMIGADVRTDPEVTLAVARRIAEAAAEIVADMEQLTTQLANGHAVDQEGFQDNATD
jgi:hypothetical protein